MGSMPRRIATSSASRVLAPKSLEYALELAPAELDRGLVRVSDTRRGSARTVGEGHRAAARQARGRGRAGQAPGRSPLGDVAQRDRLRCRAPGALVGARTSAAGPDAGAAASSVRARCTQDPTPPLGP